MRSQCSYDMIGDARLQITQFHVVRSELKLSSVGGGVPGVGTKSELHMLRRNCPVISIYLKSKVHPILRLFRPT